MSRLSLASAIVIGGLVFALACNRSANPTAPTSGLAAPVGSKVIVSSGLAHVKSTTHGEELTALIGTGSGIVNVTPTGCASPSVAC